MPNNVIFTSEVPGKVTVTVSGRGFSIIEYLTKTDRRKIEVDYSLLQNENGLLTIDNTIWRRIVTRQLGNSLSFAGINPSILEIYYSTGEHKYVPVVFGGKANVDAQHVLCGIDIVPSYVDIYAPDAQFDTVSTIKTEAVRYTNLKDTTIVHLALTPPKGVKCVPDTVLATICVDLYTTKTLKLPIFSENTPDDIILRTFPVAANISFRVSSSLYNVITEKDFALVVDYQQINTGDKKCPLILRSQPEGISNVTITPQYVDYIIEKE